MEHPIHRVTGLEHRGPFTLRVSFEDGTSQVIDFRSVLRGEIYGPLMDPDMFAQVQVDPEAHTLVWPNGADFDPAVLHDWPEKGPALELLAARWTLKTAR